MAYLEKTRSRSPLRPLANQMSCVHLFHLTWEERVSLLIAIGLLLTWELAARQQWISTLFFPAPSTIAQILLEEMASGALLRTCLATLTRLSSGLLLGGGLGLLLGLLLGWSPRFRSFFEPWIAATHPIPKLSILPLFMIVFGIGETSKIVAIATSTFFPMLVNTLAGVQQIAPIYFDVATNYGASNYKLFTRLLVPASLPFILTGLRLALNTALLLTIAVELISAKNGLGAMVWMAWQTLRIADLYVSLFVTALLGIGFSQLCRRIDQWLLPWQRR